jgi:hypothetical protein
VQRLEEAVDGLEAALTRPPAAQQTWCHLVRQRLGHVSAELTAESAVATDEWFSARAGHLERERNRLLSRLTLLAATVSDGADLESVRQSLIRLVHDIQHHHERVNDLQYDALALDMGGSE